MHLYVHIYKYTHCTNVLRCRVISVFISECDIDFLCGSKALHLLSHCSVMLSSLSQTSCKSQANVCDLFCSWQLQLRKKGIRMWTLSSIDRTLVINLRIQHFISARTAVSHSGLTSVNKGWATVAVPPRMERELAGCTASVTVPAMLIAFCLQCLLRNFPLLRLVCDILGGI